MLHSWLVWSTFCYSHYLKEALDNLMKMNSHLYSVHNRLFRNLFTVENTNTDDYLPMRVFIRFHSIYTKTTFDNALGLLNIFDLYNIHTSI